MIQLILHIILQLIYFSLPAYTANMTPALAADANIFPRLNIPIDRGLVLADKKPLFGNHKTLRGYLVGLFFGMFIALIQGVLYFSLPKMQLFSLLNFNSYGDFLLLGFLLSFGALVGDTVTSFFKRRISLKPGDSWVPWDQTSFMIGAFIFSQPLFMLPLHYWGLNLLIGFFLHLMGNFVGYICGWQKAKM